jgi:hypothetical protein
MRFTRKFLAVLCLSLGMIQLTSAQAVDTITIGASKAGEVTESNPAPSFFFDAEANQVLTIQLTSTTEGFAPVLLVADSENQMLDTFSASSSESIVGGAITIPESGRYFVQIQGVNGSRGAFTLALLEGDIPINSSTPEVENTAEVLDDMHPLSVGDQVESQVDQTDTERSFTFDTDQIALAVQVRGGGADTAFTVTLTSDVSGAIVGQYQAPAIGGAFIVPPSSGSYTLTVQRAAADPAQPFVVSLSDYRTGEPLDTSEPLEVTTAPSLEPSATLVPSPAATPAPLPPEEIDAILTWNESALMFTNVSGGDLDVRMLAFTGSGRHVDMTFWAQSNPTLDLSAFPSDTCAGFRPLAYPDAPPLSSGCSDLAAWWSANIVHFWGGDEFDLLYNGAVIATCATSDGQCGIDLPDA